MFHQKRTLSTVFFIYFVCFVFRIMEYFILRTDRTFWGEAFVHKLIGIAILFFTARLFAFRIDEIGFSKEKVWKNLLKGLVFGIFIFAIAYGTEVLISVANGTFESVQMYVSTYAVDGNIGNRTAAIFFFICFLGNAINVVMEEGIFRGLFSKILQKRYSFLVSSIIASGLFGLWHIVGPIRNYYDGDLSLGGLIANAIMLIVTSALVGFKFALLTKMTGSLYMAMGDHFVNNTIVNILHVVSNAGADELMVVRITIAQTLSFLVVLVGYVRMGRKR